MVDWQPGRTDELSDKKTLLRLNHLREGTFIHAEHSPGNLAIRLLAIGQQRGPMALRPTLSDGLPTEAHTSAVPKTGVTLSSFTF